MNRNKLIIIFIANISNAVVHEILEKSIEDNDELRKHYDKEYLNFMEIAKKYREKINPVNIFLPSKDVEDIKYKIKRIVSNELKLRISKSYKGIRLDLIDEIIEDKLKEVEVI